MKRISQEHIYERQQNSLAFWVVSIDAEGRSRTTIQRKRLPKWAPQRVRDIQRLFVAGKGSRLAAIKFARPDHDSIRDAIEEVNAILQGSWRKR